MHDDYRDTWLTGLGQRMGLSSLSFDDDALCQLGLNNDIALVLQRTTPGDTLLAFASRAIPDPTPALLRQMLMANRLAARINAPVLSLSDDGFAIEAHLRLTREELATGDDDGLERLVGALEYWHECAVQHATQPAERRQPAARRQPPG